MKYISGLFKKYWPIIVIFTIPIPSLFWLPKGHSLLHGPFYPWPDNFYSLFEIATQYLYSWISGGFGFSNTEPSGFLFFFISSLFLKIGGSPYFGQTLFFYFGFIGILGGIYFLSRTLGIGRAAAIFSGIFYLFSPIVFTGIPIEIINFKLIPFHIFTPILLAFFIRTLNGHSFKKNLSLFGAVCFLSTMAYSSLQYLFLHVLILLIYSFFFIIVTCRRKIVSRKILLRICLIFGVMFLINYFWLSTLLFDLKGSYDLRAEPGFSISHDSDMLDSTSIKIINIFRMLPHVSQTMIYPWISYYHSPLLIVITFSLLLLGIKSIAIKQINRFTIFSAIWLIIAIFLAKGTEKPFSSLSDILFSIHPYLTRLFRNITYLELLLILPVAILIGFFIDYLLKKNRPPIYRLVIIIIFIATFAFWGWPFISIKIFDLKDSLKPSQHNVVPEYFKETLGFLKKRKELSRVNAIPQFTFQDSFVSYKWTSAYFGVPPMGVLSGKSLYRPLYPMLTGKVDKTMDNVLHPQANFISNKSWNILLSISNVRYVTFHRDVAWDILYDQYSDKTSPYTEADLEEFLSANKSIEKKASFDKIDVYRVANDFFLPPLYVSKNNLKLKRTVGEILRISKEDNWEIRSTLFFENQNVGKEGILKKLPENNSEHADLPTLEFKKINPTKYRVRVHSARGVFPLVFSESFHDGWRAYATKVESRKLKVENDLNNYKILDGNEDDQASKEELEGFIKDGCITDLGNGKEKEIDHQKWNSEKQKEELDYKEKYTIDFVSKNFQGTIQNDNLPNGHFWETWFQIPIKNNEEHLVANGYANSWVIDSDNICRDIEKCTKNPDGSYDFELVVEFWPQRLFYIGVGISGITLLGCLIYLSYDWKRNRDKIRLEKNDQQTS